MGFFDVEDGEGGTVEDRVAIVVVACFAVSWIPIMLIWKCVSVVRRRSRNAEQGDVPVTTHASDPEKHPLPPQMVPGARFSIPSVPYGDEDNYGSRDKPYRSSEVEGPRRPEPLAGGRRHRCRDESARVGDRSHDADKDLERVRRREDFDSAKHERSSHAEKDPHKPSRRQRGRRSEYDHYPDEPVRKDENRLRHKSRRRHEDQQESENALHHGTFEEVSI